MKESIEAVRAFWEAHPLWTGESQFEPGSREFYEEHLRVVTQDGFGGSIDDRIFPPPENKDGVLDLGCGPGLWTVELARHGCTRIVAADLTENALNLTRKRCTLYDVQASFALENAESLTFRDSSFSHVNCQGVIHHTPDTERCIAEIARVLRPGGTASISVYYRNIFLRAWPVLRPAGLLLAGLGARLKGRGREGIFAVRDVNQIVRLYDGAQNPIGKCYSREAFLSYLTPFFTVRETFLHFFPVRALPFEVPRVMRRFLDQHAGFLIYASLTRR